MRQFKHGLPRRLAWLRRGGGLAEPYRQQIEGDWEKAAQLWTDLGCPYDAAMALADASAEAALRESLGILTGLGRGRRRPDRPPPDALARHPVHPHRPADRHPGASEEAGPARERGPRPHLRGVHQRRDLR